MDDARFDAWTRRRFGLAIGGALAAMLVRFGLPRIADGHDARTACKKKDDKKKRKKCLKRANRHNEAHTTPRVFEVTGASQTYTVPARGTLTVEVIGGEGGHGGDGAFGGEFGTLTPGAGGAGGLGSEVSASFPVTAGEVLRIEVGGAGANGGKGGAGGQGGPADLFFCSGFAEDGDPGVASPENLINHGAGGGGGCTFGPPGATVGLGPGGPGQVTVTFAFA